MADQPLVCAVMLTRNRPKMARRAVECFRAQTYASKHMLILDSGTEFPNRYRNQPDIWLHCVYHDIYQTVGSLRNFGGAAGAARQADVLIHWDDDDWSHPRRIEEQVALLQSSKAECVGYRDMLFWREHRECAPEIDCPLCAAGRPNGGEAWLYSNPNPQYCLGTSLCYWHRTWVRKPFEAKSQGEDERFITGLKCVGVSSGDVSCWAAIPVDRANNLEPRMIARIHAGNTSNAYDPAKMSRKKEWRRVPGWDRHCMETMNL